MKISSSKCMTEDKIHVYKHCFFYGTAVTSAEKKAFGVTCSNFMVFSLGLLSLKPQTCDKLWNYV